MKPVRCSPSGASCRFDRNKTNGMIECIYCGFPEAVDMQTREQPLAECPASSQGCRFGPHGMNGEIQCAYCGTLAPFTVDEDTRLRMGVAISNYLTDPEHKDKDWCDSHNVDYFIAEILRAIGPIAWRRRLHRNTRKVVREISLLTRTTNHPLFYDLRVPVVLMERFDMAMNREFSDVAEPEAPDPLQASVEAIKFALEADQGFEWLQLWNEGQFDACRKEWPEAPESCYIGADPSLELKKT